MTAHPMIAFSRLERLGLYPSESRSKTASITTIAETTVPVGVHTFNTRFTNPLYASLTPSGLEAREIILPSSICLSTSLGDIKHILHLGYRFPLDIQ